jgi:hypothetical protein
MMMRYFREMLRNGTAKDVCFAQCDCWVFGVRSRQKGCPNNRHRYGRRADDQTGQGDLVYAARLAVDRREVTEDNGRKGLLDAGRVTSYRIDVISIA